MIEGGTLSCPTCGAGKTPGALRCANCNADLQTLQCPGCYTLNFASCDTCTRCGQELADFRRAAEGATKRACPRCEKPLWELRHNDLTLQECRGCNGYWIDDQSFSRVQERQQQPSAWEGFAASTSTHAPQVEKVRYIRCPTCQKLMSRINFARVSGVMLDVCKGHGTWFDHDELGQILAFISKGGLDKARQKDVQRLKEAQREHQAKRHVEPISSQTPRDSDNASGTIVSLVLEVLISLV